MPKLNVNPLLFSHHFDTHHSDPENAPMHDVLSTEVTLRDLFAGFALAGRRADGEPRGCGEIAKLCYADADMMLTERMK